MALPLPKSHVECLRGATHALSLLVVHILALQLLWFAVTAQCYASGTSQSIGMIIQAVRQAFCSRLIRTLLVHWWYFQI